MKKIEITVLAFEQYLDWLEEKRLKDEPFNKQAYNNAHEMSAVISLYKYGSREISQKAAKIINKYF